MTLRVAGVPNGQPKMLLSLFFDGYPLMNFAACSAVYVFVSYRLFVLTNDLKNVVSIHLYVCPRFNILACVPRTTSSAARSCCNAWLSPLLNSGI